jgi:hydrogenase maturation protease
MSVLNPKGKTLVIGIGNDGRGDDAMGWLFADWIAQKGGMEVEYRYQLQIEDAELISLYEAVIFVDASLEEMELGFYFNKCIPAAAIHFSTHKIDPATILWLAKEIYGATVVGYVLAIRGYNWQLEQGLSAEAKENYSRAVAFFEKEMMSGKTMEMSFRS